MEESEKRRERLRAMRMEAAQVDVANYVETYLPNYLSNPLVESSATMVGQPEPCTAPRFDYYTNPMSAFSANKKRGKIDDQTVSDSYVPSHPNNYPAPYVPSHPNNYPAAYVPSHPNNSPETYVPSHPNNSTETYVPSHPNNSTETYVPSHPNNSPATYVPSHQNNSQETYVPSYHNNSLATYVPSHHNNSPATYVPSHINNSPATYVPSHHNNSSATYLPSHHNNSPATYGASNFPGLRNPEMSPSSTHQFHQHSPDQRTFYARGIRGSGGHGSPAIPRPFPMDQGTPDMWRGPRSPFVNQFPGHPPRGMSSPGSPFVNQFPSHLPREMSSPSLVSGPRGNSYTNPTQDRVNYHSPSPSPGYQGSSSPGGGSHGHRGNMSPSPRFGPGRGVGSHGRHFSSDKSPIPEQFYNPSMLEDPWKILQPGIWRKIAPLSSSGKFGTKKARVSNSSSGPSLAEYLAASFNEAVNDAPSV